MMGQRTGPSLIDEEAQRPRFEAWMRRDWPQDSLDYHQAAGYTDRNVNNKWRGWIAAKEDSQ